MSYDEALAKLQGLFPAFDLAVIKAALRALNGRLERATDLLFQLQEGRTTADAIFSAAEAAKAAAKAQISAQAPSSSASLSPPMDASRTTDIETAASLISQGIVPDDFLRPPSYFRV